MAYGRWNCMTGWSHTHTQICLSREKRRFLIFLALWTSFRSHTMANHPKHSFNCSNPRCHHLFSSEIDDNFMIKYLKSSYKLRKEHFEPLDKRNKTEKIKYAPTHCLIMKCFSVFFSNRSFSWVCRTIYCTCLSSILLNY